MNDHFSIVSVHWSDESISTKHTKERQRERQIAYWNESQYNGQTHDPTARNLQTPSSIFFCECNALYSPDQQLSLEGKSICNSEEAREYICTAYACMRAAMCLATDAASWSHCFHWGRPLAPGHISQWLQRGPRVCGTMWNLWECFPVPLRQMRLFPVIHVLFPWQPSTAFLQPVYSVVALSHRLPARGSTAMWLLVKGEWRKAHLLMLQTCGTTLIRASVFHLGAFHWGVNLGLVT